MSEKQSGRTARVGEAVEVLEGAEVVRPGGARHCVTGGSYVLDEPGDFTVAGEAVRVR